jgi:FkbM family methyltransferase
MAARTAAATVKRWVRPLVPNLSLRVSHVEPGLCLRVRLGAELGFVARGTRSWEPRAVAVLRRCIEPGSTVYDVGANIGFYTLLFSRWAKHVVAYEPDPANLALLRANLRENCCRNVVVRPLALAAQTGPAAFRRDLVTGQTGHLGDGPTYSETQFAVTKSSTIAVDTSTLDADVSLLGTKPDVLKLDVEGGECDVLLGGVRVLTDYRPVVVSELSTWDPDGRSQRRHAVAKMLGMLEDLNYRVFDVEDGSRVTAAGQAWMVLCVPSERVSDEWLKCVLPAPVRTRD